MGYRQDAKKLRLGLNDRGLSDETILLRLDITQIFCEVNDFCLQFASSWPESPIAEPRIDNFVKMFHEPYYRYYTTDNLCERMTQVGFSQLNFTSRADL
jgi:hypothetical protein